MNENLAPLFHFWGIPPSDALRSELQSLPRATQVYDRIEHYRSIAPRTRNDFQEVYDDQAHLVGVQDVRYEGLLISFDQARGNAIVANIDAILCEYCDARCDP